MKQIDFLSFKSSHDCLESELVSVFRAVLNSGHFVNGKYLARFESDWGEFLGCSHSIGVSNGLDGLVLALKCLGVSTGDEVLVPAHTFIASFLSVTHVGAVPVPVDCCLASGLVDVAQIEGLINNRTKAIMPVHLYGQAVDMDSVMDIANRHGLMVIEDNAQAHGSAWMGKKTGTLGHINSTSLYPGKNLGALGDAGVVTTEDENFARKVRLLRNYGSGKKYVNEILGHNMRLDEMHAAFLSVKLRYLDAWTLERKRLAARYDEMLEGVGDLKLPFTSEGADHVYHLYVVRTQARADLVEFLKEHGVSTLIHYPIPPHMQKCYVHMGWKQGQFPIAEELAETVLSMPLYPGLTEQDQDYVVECVKLYFRG
jgi:dTDP-4-amino-4,6-dideoxygalactose transaminase